MLEVRESPGCVSFRVRVQPQAARDELVGEWQGALRIRLVAPALEDRANNSLRRFLASRLNVALVAVRIAGGERSRNKRIEVRGATAAQVRAMAVETAKQDRPGEHGKGRQNDVAD